MRTIVAWTLTMALGVGASSLARAQGPQSAPKKQAGAASTPKTTPAPTPAPLDPAAIKARQDADRQAAERMNSVLAEWEKQSAKISSLDVAFDRIDRSRAWGDQYYQGRAMLQSPDLACLEFTKYKEDAGGKPINQLESEPSERIVCNGVDILQYTWDDKKVFIFPLNKQIRQKALQQGPLPFLFNMKADAAKRRYSMTLVKEDPNDYVIGIVPNEEIDKQSFTQAFLKLSKQTFLPDELWLYPVGNKPTDRQEFKFTGNRNAIKANKTIDPTFFKYVKLPGWKEFINPGEDAQVRNPAPPPQVEPVAPQPKRQATNTPTTRPATRPQ